MQTELPLIGNHCTNYTQENKMQLKTGHTPIRNYKRCLEAAHDRQVIITVFSSGGFKVEAWNYFTWKDLKIFKNKDETFKGVALLIYGKDEESYWTHITPEACKYLGVTDIIFYTHI